MTGPKGDEPLSPQSADRTDDDPIDVEVEFDDDDDDEFSELEYFPSPKIREPEPRDRHRFWFAMILIALFSAEVLLTLAVVIFAPDRTDPVLSILNVVMAPTVAILGSIMGFYFGTQASKG